MNPFMKLILVLRGVFVGRGRRAGQGIRDAKEVYRGFKHLKEDVDDIQTVIDARNAQEVRDEFLDFFQDYFTVDHTLFTMTDSNQVVQYKIISKFSEVFASLDVLVKDPFIAKMPFNSELKKSVRELHKAFSVAKGNSDNAVRMARGLKKEKESWAEKKVSADDWLIRMMRIHAKHFKNTVKHEQREESMLFKYVCAVQDYVTNKIQPVLAKGKPVQDHSLRSLEGLVKKLLNEIEKNAELVRDAFEDADELEKDLTEVSKRIKHLDEEELAKMHGLLSSGFPPDLVEQIDAKHHEEKVAAQQHLVKNYQQALKIRRDANKLAA